jgi:long-chain acyl-CoA synthetase
VNANLARYEAIRRWAILPAEFKVETGELTPSLKVRRRVVEERYRDVLEGLYAEAPPPNTPEPARAATLPTP